MPVLIKDFSVETNGQGAAQAPAPSQAGPAQSGPPTDRQIAEALKAAQQRACRLHAD
jgi:hypothetical protein